MPGARRSCHDKNCAGVKLTSPGYLKRGTARTRCRRGTAFTLIELMVVVALVGILSALIIPEMRGTYEEALLRSTSRELIDAFQVAYSRAVSFNQPHRFRFDPSTRRYIVERRAWDAGREAYEPLRDVPGCEGKLDARISIRMRAAPEAPDNPAPPDRSAAADYEAADASQLTFYADGTADAGEVMLEDREGFRLLLRINPVTARVRILELGRQ